MKTTIRNSIIGAMSLCGLFAIITSAGYENNKYQDPEPKGVWEMHFSTIGGSGTAEGRCYTLNTKTGEVRKFSRTYPTIKGEKLRNVGSGYIVMTPQVIEE